MIDPPAAIRARQLSKSFGGRIVLDALDLEIAPGQSVAVTGADGPARRPCWAAWPCSGPTAARCDGSVSSPAATWRCTAGSACWP